MKAPEMVLRKCITRGCKDTVNLPVYWRAWLKCFTCNFGPSKGITHIPIEDGVCENSLVPVTEVKEEVPSKEELEKAEWKKARKEIQEAIKSWFQKNRKPRRGRTWPTL